MTEATLTDDELRGLVEKVFQPRGTDRDVAILVDLPDARRPDHPRWRERRELAADWTRRLDALLPERRVRLFAYRHAGANNADLPSTAWPIDPAERLPETAETPDASDAVPFEEIWRGHTIAVALTELSATAPLKVAVRGRDLRAATMPGFRREMVPALRLDQVEVDRRCRLLAARLDRATAAELRFRAGGAEHRLRLDLRHNPAHPSGGLLTEPGSAGNLPSGETYVVPWEGTADDQSRSQGELPVELVAGDELRGAGARELVVYRIEGNRAVAVAGDGPVARREAERIRSEPAYANLAELGLGVLGDFGIRPIGSILLDEKLGLHIAFGRSDHFGGLVGPSDFSSPEAVVHIDRVFLPETQPGVEVLAVDLVDAGGAVVPLMRGGSWVPGLWSPASPEA